MLRTAARVPGAAAVAVVLLAVFAAMAAVLAGPGAPLALAHPRPAPTVAPPSNCGGMEVCVGVSAPGQVSTPAPHKPGRHRRGTPQCAFRGVPVPCSDPNLGVYSGSCYYQRADPQPPKSMIVWAGHPDGTGAVYEKFCLLNPDDPALTTPGGLVWLAQPPRAQAVDPAVLAQRAVDAMRLAGPRIGIVPRPGERGTVGMPVWLWDVTAPTTWGPVSASASASGVTVTATGHVSSIDWAMGDGSTVHCTGPGTPYGERTKSLLHSPTCGHVYAQTSAGQPQGVFRVTATSTWTVPWRGGGQQGVVTVTRQSAVDLTVGEVQVLNEAEAAR